MAITEADRQRMGTPHPELIEAIERAPFPDLKAGDPEANSVVVRRNRAAHLARLRHLYPTPSPIPNEVRETEHQIPIRDGSTIAVRVYISNKPKDDASGRPLIVMFHEGGWRMGDLTDEDLNCRMFARDLGAVCVNVDYRLAPEVKFPTGVNDAYDAVRWCAKTASPSSDVLPADPRCGFIVGGASAGGNFAAVMCQIARYGKLDPPLTGQYLCVPALLNTSDVPAKWRDECRSRAESKLDPVLSMPPNPDQKRNAELQAPPEDPRYSPLLHPDLAGLPPAFFQLGGLDPLRDEALLYERLLREEHGTPTRLNVYDGFGHMFWTNWPTMERSREFVDDTRDGVRWLLGTTRPSPA